MNLIQASLRAGWNVKVLSPSQSNAFESQLQALGVVTHSIRANDPAFDSLILKIEPDAVVFDRFLMEEQFGWRVRKNVPQALRIVDTQDLHSLRRFREVRATETPQWDVVLDHPIGEAATADLLRELSSIWRSDLSLILSDREHALLTQEYGVSDTLLSVQRFGYDLKKVVHGPQGARETEGFFWIGNYRHPPNLDGVRYLLHEIWPGIAERLPAARLFLHGAYPPKIIEKWVQRTTRAVIVSSTPDAIAACALARVSLFPLRYGAGIKGKISDSWAAGTPVLTTSAGIEGMVSEQVRAQHGDGACVADQVSQIIDAAVRLYEDAGARERLCENGRSILRSEYDEERLFKDWTSLVSDRLARLRDYRSRNLHGQALWMNQARATEFFSRWIELKERLNGSPAERA